jgi:hypothetical protein
MLNNKEKAPFAKYDRSPAVATEITLTLQSDNVSIICLHLLFGQFSPKEPDGRGSS